ncbi:MAG TPA: lipoate--protein ligase family protein [Gemmataceae bacterium]|nr:lipoate--protein ligase family protein [Gemmataceae bacterium]
MRLLDLTLPTAAENLALDEALLLSAEDSSRDRESGRGESNGEVLRLWQNPTPAVVLGAGGSVAIDVNTTACDRDGVPILRRASGGGTVVLGPGCLCFSVVLKYSSAPGLDQIPASNRYVLGRTLNAVKTIAPSASVEGTSDLAVNGVKFSGNAQQRKRAHFLHHGTLLCGFDLSLVSRYLNAPERQPEYRQSRPHNVFVGNLPVGVEAMARLLVEEWQPAGGYGPVPVDRVRELISEKYGREEWNRRR